jgi:hypothetical protein
MAAIICLLAATIFISIVRAPNEAPKPDAGGAGEQPALDDPRSGSNGTRRTIAPSSGDDLLEALDALRCGDVLRLTGTHTGPAYVPSGATPTLWFDPDPAADCPTSNPVTVTGANANPQIRGLVRFNELRGWVLDNIDVTWPDTGSASYTDHLVKLQGGRDWRWANSEFYDARSLANVLIAPSKLEEPVRWALTGNCIHGNYSTDPDVDDNRSHGIYVAGGSRGQISRNLIFDIFHGQGLKLDSGTGGQSPEYTRFAYNTISKVKEHPVFIGTNANNNVGVGNLLVDSGPGKPAVRAYNLTGKGNALRYTGYWGTIGLLKYYPDPPGGHISVRGTTNAYPLFDDTTRCSGFHPKAPIMQAFGRYAYDD